MVPGEIDVLRRVIIVEQVGQQIGRKLDLVVLAHVLEDRHIVFLGRRSDLDLVMDPAQRPRIHQLLRRNIGREHQQLVERCRELLSGVKGQEINPRFERNDPPVDHVLWADQLAAEIIDEEQTAGGLELRRRFVKFRDRVEGEIEHFQRQLTAGVDHRPAAADPAPVRLLFPADFGVLLFLGARGRPDHLVNGRIEHLDDVAVDLEAVGDENGLLEHVFDRLGDDRLAVSRGTVQQDGAPGIHRRPDQFDQLLGHDQMGKAFGKRFGADLFVGDQLFLNLLPIVRQGDRRRADILRLVQGLDGPLRAFARQAVSQFRNQAVAESAQGLHQAFFLGVVDQHRDDRAG